MREAVLQILCAGLGALGFGLVFHVQKKHLFLATLGGTLSWLWYLLVFYATQSVLLGALVASLGICLWSETMARVRKAPANVFLIPGIVPLLPGGALYYTMSGIVNGDMAQVILKGKETALMAVGIVGGIVIASEIVRLIMGIWERRKKAGEKPRA
ncbi:MAG: threonine/serine exporter family protein [Evtepia sp.]|uniref:threonine/serine exporter family protein n=1 Tax=Evtepia sp. TaxID=2773933 RepID=UPI002A75A187|nr:threonine/serine exporter family protein [Evtepia sp.]MDY3015159.1 threonine/serine exporter family protein [Evtepia sp.]